MKLCGRCSELMREGEYEPYDNPSPTGAGTTIYLHKKLCKQLPTQTAPVQVRRH